MKRSVKWPMPLALTCLVMLVAGCEVGDSGTDTTIADTLAGDDVPATCPVSEPLHCGARIEGSIASASLPDQWDGYSCTQRFESGPEALYAIDTSRDCRLALRLVDLSTDLDLLALNACDPSACFQASSTPIDIQGIESVVFQVKPGQSRWVAVDGYADASGSYTLESDCLCGPGAEAFGDGTWELKVDRRWNGGPGSAKSPSDPLDEKDYVTVQDGATYSVEVSDTWMHVSVGSEPLAGVSKADDTGALWYDLAAGTFAGGRFRIWVDPSGIQAERTIYGSAVPIVSSERGALSPAL